MTRLLIRLYGLVDGRERVLAYLVALLTVAACWAVILASGDRLKSLDEGAFLALAQNLAGSGSYVEEPGVPTAYRAPGLVFFLTPFAALGLEIVGLRLVNAALIGLGLVLVYHLVARRAGPLAGLFATVMIPAWPVVIYAGTTLYPQTLAAFLLVLTVFAIDRQVVSDRLRGAIWSGIAYALLLLTIPIVLLLWPIIALYLLIQTRRKLAHVLVFTLVGGAVVGSWTYRNYVVFDHFIPVATSSGYNLLAGNAPNARFDTSLNVRFPEYVYTEITGKSEVEKNDIMTEAAIRLIREDPQRAAQLYVGKFLHWFDYSNRLLSDDVVEGGASALAPSKRDMILLASYLLVIALPLVAHVLAARRHPFTRMELLFVALWVCSGLAYAIFFTRVRFRLPFDWLLITSNAMFLAAVIERWIGVQRPPGGPVR
ncbi:MAG: 4-amino-4-deoxy-L-arabinose transferase and related glycosyltransferases of PMT family [Rhodobacteraceae bacterium HLUCCA08]|nr:MAG: 4-amino-4-deoxy-L-arabinose transferase and related glycosyltransferases of PMT family [Rhodobacteraceae bacterium HLUCCA08]